MQLTDLKKIGLTEGEIKVYQALLELGETTRTQLAKKSGISPSKIYDVANRLLEKGIISSVRKNNVIHFSPADPERIKDFLKQKEEELEQEKEIFQQIKKLLTSREQLFVELCYTRELASTKIAAILKTTENNVYQLKNRIREKMNVNLLLI